MNIPTIAKDYIFKKLQEPSTIGGILLWVAGQLHLQFSAQFNGALTQVILAIVSLTLVLLNEGSKVTRPISEEGKK